MKEDKKNERGEVSRRDFLVGAGAVVVGGAIGAGITYPLVSGKGGGEVVTTTKTVSVPTTVTTTVGGGATVTTTLPGGTKTVTTTVAGEGAVEPAFAPLTEILSMNAFATMCTVKDGKMIRSRAMHFDEKQPDLKPWTMTARGQSWTCPIKSPLPPIWAGYRQRVYSPNRVLYPLKRVDWEPGGDPAKINAQNRGKSKFKRISWDEATDIIASELKRVADTYGTAAISNVKVGGHGEGYKHNVQGHTDDVSAFLHYWSLKKYGTYITDSHEEASSACGGEIGGIFMIGPGCSGYEGANGTLINHISRYCDQLYIWGGDTQCKSYYRQGGMMGPMMWDWFRKLKIRIVYITPDCNMGTGSHADKWVPVLPQTDCALMLAIAYTWLTEDTYAKNYLSTHALGYDKWFDYVLGNEDGVEKTPEWAAPLCGVPEWTIKALARQWYGKRTSIGYGHLAGGVGRAPYSSEPYRTQLCLLAMQGWGAPGRHQLTGFSDSRNVAVPAASPAPGVYQIRGDKKTTEIMAKDLGIKLDENDRTRPFVAASYLEKAILDPPLYYSSLYDQFFWRKYPMDGMPEIHMIWASACKPDNHTSGYGFLKALQSPKIECHIIQTMFLESGCPYSDIVLPICVQAELSNFNASYEQFTTMYAYPKVVEPIGESKSDLNALIEVGKKLDFWEEISDGGKPYDQLIVDRIKEGYDTSRWGTLVSWEELSEKGYHTEHPREGWMEERPPLELFFLDPVTNPVRTPSGLLEFESQELLENNPDDKERPPVPHWVRGGPASEGWSHDVDPYGERAKTYPLEIVSSCSAFRYHGQNNDEPWLREITKIIAWDGYAYEILQINPADAAARGIEHKDIVKIYNDRGAILGIANVCERVIPGAVNMDKGCHGLAIIPAELYREYAPNMISGPFCVSKWAYGGAYSGFLVEVEKVTGNQMDEWRKNYPDAFAQDYDPAYGPLFSGWVVKEV